ncbi:MAG: ThuA domain-containing protein [Gemmatimonadota bacterium]
MKLSRIQTAALALALSTLTALACAPRPDPEPESDPARVLVFSRTAGYRHASIEPGIEAIRAIGQAEGFEVQATEDPSVFTSDGLDPFAAVVFLSTTQDVLDEPQQRAFAEYIRGGGAFVGVHAASATEYDWPWYGRLVGGYFAGHPNDPNVREGVVRVADAGHPSTETLPDPWVRQDEWYDFGELEPGLNVLLEVDEGSYKRPEEDPAPSPRPIAWYHEFDGGRSWYTALGHTSESFSEPEFLDHLRGGLRYALGAP